MFGLTVADNHVGHLYEERGIAAGFVLEVSINMEVTLTHMSLHTFFFDRKILLITVGKFS